MSFIHRCPVKMFKRLLAVVTTALMDGDRQSVGEKWANLYVVKRLLSP